MSQYDKLVRLREWELDEKRRALADMLSETEVLIEKRKALEDELRREQTIASESPESAISYNSFANSVISRRKILDADILEKQSAAAAANKEVALAYQEMRKAEIVRDALLDKERKEQEKLEQREIDEIGQEMIRRKNFSK